LWIFFKKSLNFFISAYCFKLRCLVKKKEEIWSETIGSNNDGRTEKRKEKMFDRQKRETIHIPGYIGKKCENDEHQQHEKQQENDVWVDSTPVDEFYEKHKRAIVHGRLVVTDIHTGEMTMFDGRNCGIACDAIWPILKDNSDKNNENKENIQNQRKNQRHGRGFKNLSLWQLRRFIAVWREIGDYPEHFQLKTLKMDATTKLMSGHYNPRVIGIRASKSIDTSNPTLRRKRESRLSGGSGGRNGRSDGGRGLYNGVKHLFLFSLSFIDQILTDGKWFSSLSHFEKEIK
jgi:hypothetical protein